MDYSVLCAILLSFINFLLGLTTAKLALKKPLNLFNRIVFGSFVIRYFLIAIAFFILLKYYIQNHFNFAISFVFSTFILIFVEILYLNNRANFLNLRDKKFK